MRGLLGSRRVPSYCSFTFANEDLPRKLPCQPNAFCKSTTAKACLLTTLVQHACSDYHAP
eukprot:3769041-Prymnesium_polylepis.1